MARPALTGGATTSIVLSGYLRHRSRQSNQHGSRWALACLGIGRRTDGPRARRLQPVRRFMPTWALAACWLARYLAPQFIEPIDRGSSGVRGYCSRTGAARTGGAPLGRGSSPAGSTTAKSHGNRKRSASKSRCSAAQAGVGHVHFSAAALWYRNRKGIADMLAGDLCWRRSGAVHSLGYDICWQRVATCAAGRNSTVRRWHQPVTVQTYAGCRKRA